MADVIVNDQGDLVAFEVATDEFMEWLVDNYDGPSLAWVNDKSFVVAGDLAEDFLNEIEFEGFNVEVREPA